LGLRAREECLAWRHDSPVISVWQGRAAVAHARISLWQRCFDLCAHGEKAGRSLSASLSFNGDARAAELDKHLNDLSQPPGALSSRNAPW